MEKNKPLILISNDDGVISKGISALIRFLRPLGDIVVMAPDAPRSGVGCGVSINEPVKYQMVRKDVGLSVYSAQVPLLIASSWLFIRFSTVSRISL